MTIERASDNPYPSVLMVEGDPTALADNPASGQRRLAVGTDHLLYLVDPSGVKTAVGAGLSDPMTTRGDMIIRNASNATARAPIGSAGKVWTSDGTDPSWQTPSAGGGSYVWLQRQTASSSATLDFTGFISSTYTVYEFVFFDIFPATDNTSFGLRVGTGGGPTWDSGSNYTWSRYRTIAASTGNTANGAVGTAAFLFDVQDSSFPNYTLAGSIRLYNPAGSSKFKKYTGNTTGIDTAGNDAGGYVWGEYGVATALTGVRFLYSSGNIASGTVDVYGLTHA